MSKYFGLCLVLIATTLGSSLPATSVEPSPLKNYRIVGGHEVEISKHPHQISMRYKIQESSPYAHFCGGSIYKANVIISASHCVDRAKPESILIVAGTNNRRGSDGVIARVSKIVMHENYDSSRYDNDIALMFLSTPLPLNNVTIAAITLANQAPKDGVQAVVTGWDAIKSGGISSDKLLEVEVPIIDNDRCDAAYAVAYGPGRISDSMICAGVEGVGGKDTCQGDSGGPLVVNKKLAGVVSWGIGCALPEYPGAYSNVAFLRNWIETKIQQNS